MTSIFLILLHIEGVQDHIIGSFFLPTLTHWITLSRFLALNTYPFTDDSQMSISSLESGY